MQFKILEKLSISSSGTFLDGTGLQKYNMLQTNSSMSNELLTHSIIEVRQQGIGKYFKYSVRPNISLEFEKTSPKAKKKIKKSFIVMKKK